MKRIFVVGLVLVAVCGATVSARAATPVPFPSPTVTDLFVSAQTVTADGTMANWFAPGSTVTFRAYAIDPKTMKFVDPSIVKYFYATIPNQPNVKLKYDPKAPGASTGMPWTGTWTVPSSYPAGVVEFKVLVQAKAKGEHQRRGQFVDIPNTAALSISSTAAAPGFSPSPGPAAGYGDTAQPFALYVDTVNGTAPAGVQARPVGCAQSNVYKRGERVVFRVWGVNLANGDLLTNDNVATATVSIPGQPDSVLGFGAHGALEFWASPWIVPANFPLGVMTAHVAFTTEDGKKGSFDYALNIIP